MERGLASGAPLRVQAAQQELDPQPMGSKTPPAPGVVTGWRHWWRRRGPGGGGGNGGVQPELVAISLVYVVQGLLGLSRLAVFTLLKDDLALPPASVALITSAGYAPWMVKPLYGFLSDTVPLFGYRRSSYLVLCGLLGTQGGTTVPELLMPIMHRSDSCSPPPTLLPTPRPVLRRRRLVVRHGGAGALPRRRGAAAAVGQRLYRLRRRGGRQRGGGAGAAPRHQGSEFAAAVGLVV